MSVTRLMPGGLRVARRVVLGLFLTALISPPTPSGAAVLSAGDERQLLAGQILYRNDLPGGGPVESGAMGGTALALLHADRDAVWRTLTDIPGHAGLFPRITESRVLEQEAGRSLVRYQVAVGPFTFHFFVNTYADARAGLIRWQLDRGRDNDLFRDHWGYWKLEPRQEGVLVTYAMGGHSTLPAFLTRGAGRSGAVQTVKALKDRVERPGA
jgi:uncharacterized protein YndB with AHSA1/START domain